MRSVFSNLLLVGGVIYMARGSYGPGFLTSADVKTGESKWSARGFPNANLAGKPKLEVGRVPKI